MAKYAAKGTRLYYGIAANPTTTLTSGKRYLITSFGSGDDFTNVGAGSNATGVEFVATGTTPTTWTHGSVLVSIELVTQAGDIELDLGERVALVDVTTHDAATDTRSKLDVGFKEPAKISFDIVYDPADTVHEALRADEATYAARSLLLKLTDSASSHWYGSARVASFAVGAPVADKLSAKVTLELLSLATFA